MKKLILLNIVTISALASSPTLSYTHSLHVKNVVENSTQSSSVHSDCSKESNTPSIIKVEGEVKAESLGRHTRKRKYWIV